MIYKHVIGRLGNQMFQYATVRAFQLEYRPNDKILLDFSEVYRRDSERFKEEISDFNISKNVIYGKMKLTLIQKIDYLFLGIIKFIVIKTSKTNELANQKLYKLECKLNKYFAKHGFYSIRIGYTDLKNSSKKNLSFFGTFESAKYFDKYRDILLEEFTPKYDILEHNKHFYDAINSSESVCITIRRGDFVERSDIKKALYVCTPEYFDKAIEKMKQLVPNARFFVFSDDVEWCKKNMNFPENTMYETGINPTWEKLRMMYSCKHFIISNSTFSWWAQYLSRNIEKVVIAPSKWNNEPYKEKMDIYEDNWTLVDPN